MIRKQFPFGSCFFVGEVVRIGEWLEKWNAFLWGVPVLGLITGTGVWLTIRLNLVQLRLLPEAVRAFGRRLCSRGSSFRALCTALAATVGTGNIAGVAGAIALGGPGALFWMWLSAILGMGIKFAESTLAVRFCRRSKDGGFQGGPMYIIEDGLPGRWRFLGWCYSLLGLIAAFGVGNATQINAVIAAVSESADVLGYAPSSGFCLILGIIFAACVIWLVSGGAEKICASAEWMIPVVSGAYILLCCGALWVHRAALPRALGEVFSGAFSPAAVTGGAVGSMMTTLRIGVSRGTFTNEAGMGTAAIAHAGAEVAHPTDQGLMGIMEVFLDTIVICTLTALVILTSGVEIHFGAVLGAELTARALAVTFGPWAAAALCGCLCVFAAATILGWGLYAGRCAEYLFGGISWKLFALCQGAGVILGAVLDTGIIWTFAEILNGLMAIPNLLAVLMLTPELVRLTNERRLCYNRRHRN